MRLQIDGVTATTISWTITGLDYDFTSTYYENAGVTTQSNFADGSSYIDGSLICEPLTIAEDTSRFADKSVSGIATGLRPNTTYNLYAFVKKISDRTFWNAGSQLYIQTQARTKPGNWSWYKANISGDYVDNATATQTVSANAALSNGGKTTNFHYKVWNDIIEKGKLFLEYKNIEGTKTSRYGHTNITYIELLERAKMRAGDVVMTAKRFNIVRYVIDQMAEEKTGLNDFNPGNIFYGSYVLKLVNSMNSIT